MGDKPSLLIVDDAPDICEMLIEACSDHFEVERAYSGAEAMQMVRSHLYDTVLVDLTLPDVGGVDVAAAASSTGAAAVMMTAHDAMTALAECPFPVIQKPFDLHLLVSLLQGVTAGHAAQSRASATE